MRTPPWPSDEGGRLAALRDYELLDTPPEQVLDELTDLAAYVCGTTSAVITLIDERRQWFKSRHSFQAAETPRELAFCAYTILGHEVVVVPDAAQDPRFADNPLVTTDPKIRFYAGAPLVTEDGYCVGSLAVIDYTPGDLDARQRRALRALAHQVVQHFELRRRMTAERRRLVGAETVTRTLVEASIDAVVVLDERGVVRDLNPAGEALFATRREDAVGRDVAALIPALRAADGGLAIPRGRVDAIARRAGGGERRVELVAIRLGDGAAASIAALVRDVTEQRERELALERSIERFELAARATKDAIWDLDLTSGRIWWGEALRLLFGHAPEELADVDRWARCLHPEDAARVTASLEEAMRGDRVAWAEEYRFRRRDGTYAHVHDRGYVVRAGDAAVRMVGAMIDVTEERRAAAQLRASEARYRELIEGVRDAILTISTDGVITSGNDATEALLGRPRAAWLGRRLLPFVDPGDRTLAAEMFARVLDGDRPPAFELRLERAGAAPVVCELTVSAQRGDDRVVGSLVVARDITERHRLEAQVRQAQKMEALGHLSGGVAHDFNNLLTVIQGNAMLLRRPGRTGEVAERAAEILEAAERAATLTRQLLLVSRRQPMQPSIVDVDAVVAEMAKMLRRILGEDVALRIEAAGGLPLVRADVGMIEQVLLNLAVNARDAMPGGGTLTIATGTREVTEAQEPLGLEVAPGRYVSITVADAGAGIAPDVLPHIFEPFFTTKEVGKGTGLGLATVYAIARQHRGWVDVSSAPGRGATFCVFLPVAEPSRARAARSLAHVTTELPRGSETLLVVEDEATLRRLMATVLEHCGYTVLGAGSAAEALAIWQRARDAIRLLVTDLIMPGGVNGHELAARLRADVPDLPVVYTTGYSADLEGEPLIEGVNLLRKPYAPGQLAALVRARLDARATRR